MSVRLVAVSLPVLLRRICEQNGWQVFPPREGGRWFSSVAAELDCTVEQVSVAARNAGLWPYATGSTEFVTPIERPGGRVAYTQLADDLCAALATPEGEAALRAARRAGG